MENIFLKMRVMFDNLIFSVPVRIKVIGIGLLPVLILGLSLNYWITTGLSDWLSYILTDVRVEAAMSAGARSVMMVTVLGAFISIVLSLALTYALTRPILSLRQMTQQVAEGNLEARAEVWAKDEIGELAIAVNTMTDHLVSTQENLARMNRSLDVINQVALAADQQVEIHDALYTVLENILAIMGLKTGWIYLRDPERNVLHLASWCGVSEGISQYLLHQTKDHLCSCQLDLVSKNLGINVRVCNRLANVVPYSRENAHIMIPLSAREQEFGIINLLCDKNLTILDADMDMLTSLGAQVSEIVANAWLRLKLAEKEAARQVLLESLVQAQEEERGRLARELHDGAGQMLTSLLVRLKTIEKKANSIDLREELEEMQEHVSETIEQVRELSYRLRPPALEEFGLAMALEALTQDIGKNVSFSTTFKCDLGGHTLPAETEVVLYRIAQEGLTNIIRHAHARKASLELSLVNHGICMLIEDDGVGFDPDKVSVNENERHLGLLSMRERAEILGGSLDVYTSIGKGTSIQVFIPSPEVVVI